MNDFFCQLFFADSHTDTEETQSKLGLKMGRKVSCFYKAFNSASPNYTISHVAHKLKVFYYFKRKINIFGQFLRFCSFCYQTVLKITKMDSIFLDTQIR